ncbi:MAG: hypothetical protein ACK5DL_05795 [Burkholderiales bacterium]|nr:hypothetical protein [Betaproteobacteria bacterium]
MLADIEVEAESGVNVAEYTWLPSERLTDGTSQTANAPAVFATTGTAEHILRFASGALGSKKETLPARFSPTIASVIERRSPSVEGLRLLRSDDEAVPPASTCCPPSNVPVLDAKVPPPPYSAVTVCNPTLGKLVVQVATPAFNAAALQPGSTTPSALNTTVPLGEGAATKSRMLARGA